MAGTGQAAQYLSLPILAPTANHIGRFPSEHFRPALGLLYRLFGAALGRSLIRGKPTGANSSWRVETVPAHCFTRVHVFAALEKCTQLLGPVDLLFGGDYSLGVGGVFTSPKWPFLPLICLLILRCGPVGMLLGRRARGRGIESWLRRLRFDAGEMQTLPPMLRGVSAP